MNLSELTDIAELPKKYCAKKVSSVWQNFPEGWLDRLEEIMLSKQSKTVNIFFRADDIGIPGVAFNALCKIFRYFEVPLALAVVPAWINKKRIDQLFQMASPSETLWSWHQHGWRHTNWEKDGKKAEFGPSRTENQKWQDLWKGLNKMKEIFGNAFVPVFTPPWNRISPEVFTLLYNLGFKAISTDQKKVTKQRSLRIFRIYIDLHTRKASQKGSDFDHLIEDCKQLFATSEPAGIMIHHNRMNLNAFLFIANFIEVARKNTSIKITSFKEMLEK
ncbi:MAG: hypothetical protein WHS38_02645 [Thermodesulforhabdaceae bacterium]